MAAPEHCLLNDFQRDFPLLSRPYAQIGERIGASEDEVIAGFSRCLANGKISRIGATFAAGRVGSAALAALAVPRGRLEPVAALVNGFPEVNHNYEREHRYNLWFVVTGPDARHVETTLSAIERAAGCGRVLPLPMVEPYHIDLGFDLGSAGSGPCAARAAPGAAAPAAPLVLGDAQRALVLALQDGLPLVAAPYASLAQRAGMREAGVLATLQDWIAARVINRFGVIVRHHELGYRANAMVVFDVPDCEVRAAGRRAAAMPFVNLCYRRQRHLPQWRYNLYCMIHGVDRAAVEAQIAQLRAGCGLLAYPHEVLFSRQRFKQRGARYLCAPDAAVHG
jgi:DNA-binding Lrp family transcriptional regulator